jgi:tetratricopeptide (TPR) repeat protein
MFLVMFFSASCGGTQKTIRNHMANGKKWFEQGDLDRAMAEYNQAIKVAPDHYAPYHGRAWVWYVKGQYDKALDDFNLAIKLSPDFSLAYRGRSHVLEQQGNLNGAIFDMKKYIELEPDDPDGTARLEALEQDTDGR